MEKQAATTHSALVRWLFPSIKDILFLGYLLGPSLVDESAVLNDGDTGWHIRNGETILRTWTFPHADYFSYTTMGNPGLPGNGYQTSSWRWFTTFSA